MRTETTNIQGTQGLDILCDQELKLKGSAKLSIKSPAVAIDDTVLSCADAASSAQPAEQAEYTPENPPCGGRECKKDCKGGQECIDHEKY